MKKQFKYYMHDGYEHYERIGFIEDQIGEKLSEEVQDAVGRPFYEITLRCEIDTETGKVEILGVE